ncbi:MAG: universal stress protein [Flavobacteriales bacterium]|nr:universal stress protein [Flavobacteriales bacterium]
MSERPHNILVPTDFTKVADYAMEHALTLAQHTNGQVFLLHVVAKAAFVEEARTKLKMDIDRARTLNDKVTINPIVRVGTIYEDIGDAAAEVGAGMIIMGTHGMRGMQFITGSRALRVVTSSKVPFIVVQERGIRPEGYNNIVVPLDLHQETRQKLTLVADMAKYFNSRVHIITPKETDEFLHNQLVRNIQFADQYLKERGVAHDAVIAEEDSGDFVDAVIGHATKVDADLIAIMNISQTNIFGILGVPYEQEIITNRSMIPVMLMNPVDTGTGGGWTFQ